MKKTKIFTLMALLCTVLFTGCGKEDDNSFDYDVNLLYGVWRIVEINISDGWVDVTTYPGNEMLSPTYMAFESDGTYWQFGVGSGTYTVDGSTVNTYIGEEEYVRYGVISLTDSSCELSMTGGVMSCKVRCQKQ